MAEAPAASTDAARRAAALSDYAALLSSPAVPATPDQDTPVFYPGSATPRAPADVSTALHSSLLDASLPQPYPLSSAPLTLPSPAALDHRVDHYLNHHLDRHLDLSFATTFLPTDLSLPSPHITRLPHNLRLPSFDVLGIAAPHPDRIPLTSNLPFSPFGAGPISKPEDPLHALSPPLELERRADPPTKTLVSSPKAALTPFAHRVPTFTPPAESGTFTWGSLVNTRHVDLGSPPNSDPGVSPNLSLTASVATPGQAPIIVPAFAEDLDDLNDAVRMAVWVELVKNIISKTLVANTLGLHANHGQLPSLGVETPPQ